MGSTDFVREEDLFLDCDLAWRAAAKAGIDPNKPHLKPLDYRVSEVGVTFVVSGTTVRLDELGLGEMRRVDTALLSEYTEGLPGLLGKDLDSNLPFDFTPREGRWYIKESEKKRLFERWGNQLATGANSFVL